jgi:putative hydrolase of the HAD superfamily
MALGGVEAVLLDSFGTLVAMEPPAPRLVADLRRRGFEVDDARAAVAFEAEISYYLEHHVEGRDAAAVHDLRDRCAGVLNDALGIPGLDLATAREAMLDAIRFSAFRDAAPALEALRTRGLRTVVCSNWDCTLREVLAGAGLGDLVDGVVSSAEVGAAKPDPRLFAVGLELAGRPPAQAVYVGDSPSNDVAGAAAAGLRAVLLRRGGRRPDRVAADSAPGTRAAAEIESLTDLARVL